MKEIEKIKNPVEIRVAIIGESEKAIKVSDEEMNYSNSEWLPKSQINYDPKYYDGALTEVTIPEWLAIEKGFV